MSTDIKSLPQLNQEERTAYDKNGYALYHKPLFETEDLQKLESVFDSLVEQNIDLDMPHKTKPELFKYLTHPRVISLVESLIGPDIALWASHFISKPPFTGSKTPWHTDSDYWANNMENIYDVKICTVWLALDDVDLENGCMGVIPGTHKSKPEEHKYVNVEGDSIFDTEIKGVDESKAVWFELKKGECSLHDPKIIHGANANKSNRRRCGYTMRYLTGNMLMKNMEHPIYRIKGEITGKGNILEIPSL